MITIKLQGGIGNQLFQYFNGLALCKSKNSKILFDISFYLKSTNRSPDIFKLIEKKPTICKIKSNSTLEKLINPFLPYYKRRIFKEKSFGYDQNIKKTCNNVALIGYWQSELYFSSIRGCILKLFDNYQIERVYRNILNQIMNDNYSVSIHVRRGDYLKAQHQSTHGVLSMQYYTRAIEIIENENKGKNISYLVFSDDIEWCRSHFVNKNYSFVEVKKPDSLSEIKLMSMCNSQIIANSTFSWWGSWLNQKEDKLVIAPEKWFANSNLQNQTNDLIPSKWLAI